MTETFKIQNNKLAKNMLERIYYQNFREGKKEIELFLFGQCSAKCKYCYLNKHSEELYPQDFSELSNILNNLQIILNWYKKEQFICDLDIFSAEWLDKAHLREPVLEIIYNNFINSEYKPQHIIIPSNIQFLNNKKETQVIQNWIDKFKNNLNIQLVISGSIDGKFCDNDRTKVEEEFYQIAHDFFIKNNFLFHPMVSSYNVKNWIENYEWWRTTFPNSISQNLMMLEVRDETWDNESIKDLLKFLNYQIDYQFNNDFYQDKKEFLKYILNDYSGKYTKRFPGYNNLSIQHNKNINDNYDTVNCSINQNSLAIRVGDLALIGCHRQAYEELILGHYLTKDNEIIDFDIKRIELFIAYNHLKRSAFPHCESCENLMSCVGFCLGNSYEQYGNSFIPVKEVCKMYNSKINFLYHKYYSMGLFEYLDDKDIKSRLNFEFYSYLKDKIAQIENEEE